MNTDTLVEQFSSTEMSALIGILVGILFGIFAQQSRFCLRAACVEFWRGKMGDKFAIWLLTFSAALIGTQLFIGQGSIDTDNIRQLNTIGSMSGAILGGLFLGAGMILARGCASRLLILSATGNMRALISGLVITVVAQASLSGVLLPVKENLSGLWLVTAHDRSFTYWLPDGGGIMLGLAIFLLALWYAKQHKISKCLAITAVFTGFCITLAWFLNSWHADNSFDIVSIKSLSFTGPSAETLMSLINTNDMPFSFNIGLIPGVFLGSLIAALITGEFKWQQFTKEKNQTRYLIGATLMGFGGVLASGCTVGTGITGGSLLLTSAWISLFFMWLGAGITDYLVDKPRTSQLCDISNECYTPIPQHLG